MTLKISSHDSSLSSTAVHLLDRQFSLRWTPLGPALSVRLRVKSIL